MKPIDLFRGGLDTMDIAIRLGLTEAAVLRSITVARSIERGAPVAFSALRRKRRVTTSKEILDAAAAIAARSGMTDTAIGRWAARDPNLLFDLRAGRRLRPATAEKIMARLRAWRPSGPRQ